MKFNNGDKVSFLNESGGGVVSGFQNGRYLIEDEDGFTRPYNEADLVLVNAKADYKIDDTDVEIIKEEAESIKVSHISHRERDKISNRSFEVWEIDLHIESIVDSHVNLTNAEIIRKQMHAFKSFYKDAISKSIRKMVVIHGVGEGVLKHEVRAFLDNLDGISYYDSDFTEYGKGATTIEVIGKY